MTTTILHIQPGQLKDVQKKYPFATSENCTIITEVGNDTGGTFSGAFLVKIKKHLRHKTIARFENGKFIKEI